MLHSYFIIQRAFNKIPVKLQLFFPCSLLNSGFGDAAELLLHISNVLQSTIDITRNQCRFRVAYG